MKFNFLNKLKGFRISKLKMYFYILPLTIIVAGILLACLLGFNKSMDFTGGTVLNVIPVDGAEQIIDVNTQTNFEAEKQKIEGVLATFGLTASVYQTSETDNGLAIQFRYQDKAGCDDEQMNDINDQVITKLKLAYGLDSSDTTYINSAERVGATATAELLKNALIAIVVAVVLIMLYIAIRFELASGLVAIITLLCDVLVTCSFVLMFRIEVGSAFIAALITIVGYSINNTIIVFDRIREIRKKSLGTKTNFEIADEAVKSTLVRTLNTTITTLFAVVLLAIIGVASVRNFIIPIIIGLLSGIYSSLITAPNLWATIYRPRGNKKKSRTIKAKKA